MIVAGGCSFTASDFQSWEYPAYDVSFKKWPEIIADHFNTTVVNFGRCGFGNDYIVDKLVPFILNNHKDIDLVVVGWTEATRFNIYNQMAFNPVHFITGKDGDKYSAKFEWAHMPYSLGQSIMKRVDMDIVANKLYDEYETLTLLCKQLGLKFIFGQMLWALDYRYIRYSFKDNGLDDTNWVRHPIFELPLNNVLSDDAIIGPLDGHPNGEGHKRFAKLYLDKYGELYGK